ncbi:MAG: enoyl-CoA hydratase-related protein [Pseudomonadales bacterium]|jgi:enoyl-CoA hydratase|nr:enoyl-CoA hydratase-related protein [Pseudomonadales bacterium]MDP7359813.1 enoyl-CoA hydratase-related protein [Pseudomonadales bacterium]HJN51390.1 enoyl-CoA hydratase-related protein [Pseudomonadales bacterium]|tara:strand:- start:657 stop:1643 length:987 start_codon:yes stop_codon:yes gene_type:complete
MVKTLDDLADRTPYENILYEKDPEDNRLVRITLNQPERMNALSYDLLMDLRHAVICGERDPEVKVLILKGAGRAFSAGFDLGPRPQHTEGITPLMANKDHINYYHQDVWFTIWDLHKPVISQVHGYALAGASELAFMCDFTIMAENSVTGYPPLRTFSVPDTFYWPWLCGLKKAKYLSMTATPITGKEAADIGLATMAVPEEELEERTELVAKRLAMIPSELLYLNKYACNRSMEMMGMRTAMEFVGKLHDYSHTFESTREFFKVSSEKGLRGALEWRDGKFGDDYRALHKNATDNGTEFSFPQALSMPEVKEALDKFEAERKQREKG